MAAVLVEHEPGWRLPRHSALARRFNVGIPEIDSAIRELTERHLLRRTPDGSVYRASPAEYLIALEGLPGIGSHIDPMGASISCTFRNVSWRHVPENIALILGLSPPAEASIIRCQWTLNGHRAAISTTYLLDHPGTADAPGNPDPASLEAALNHAPWASAAARPGCAAHPAAVHVEVRPPALSVARVLHLAPGTPAIFVTVTFTDPSRSCPVALTTAVLRSELFRIVIESPSAAAPGQWPDQASGSWTHDMEYWES